MAKKKKEKDYIDLETNRYGLFMSENSFNYEIMLGREYLKTDAPNIITLHRIDIIKTKTDDLYSETVASEKVFQPAVKLHASVSIEKGSQAYLAEGGIVNDQSGPLHATIYLKELEEKGVEINRGDIIAYNQSGERERYYEITDANNVTDDSSHTIAGMKPFWKKIIAIPVKGDVVPFV